MRRPPLSGYLPTLLVPQQELPNCHGLQIRPYINPPCPSRSSPTCLSSDPLWHLQLFGYLASSSNIFFSRLWRYLPSREYSTCPSCSLALFILFFLSLQFPPLLPGGSPSPPPSPNTILLAVAPGAGPTMLAWVDALASATQSQNRPRHHRPSRFLSRCSAVGQATGYRLRTHATEPSAADLVMSRRVHLGLDFSRNHALGSCTGPVGRD